MNKHGQEPQLPQIKKINNLLQSAQSTTILRTNYCKTVHETSVTWEDMFLMKQPLIMSTLLEGCMLTYIACQPLSQTS